MKIVFTNADAVEAIAKVRKISPESITIIDGEPDGDFANANVDLTKRKGTRKPRTDKAGGASDGAQAQTKTGKKKGATEWTPGEGSK